MVTSAGRAPVVRAATDLLPVDAQLLLQLKAWRLAEARTQAVPAYVILHDSTLTDIARRRPRDLAALSTVSGIGTTKLARYGASLLEVVAADAQSAA